jgi:hypothetical protein
MNQPRIIRGAITRHTAEALNMTSPNAPACAKLEATKPMNPINAIIAAIFGMDINASTLKPVYLADKTMALH